MTTMLTRELSTTFTLNPDLIIKALEAYKLTHPEGDISNHIGNKMWRDSRVDEQIALLKSPVHRLVLLQQYGGQWLGQVREWLKCTAINGETVTWGSNDELRFRQPVTVSLVEEIASIAAAAAINETKGIR